MKNLIKAQRALLTLLVVSFVTLFSVGCGSNSSNDFVFTGTTDNAPPTTGNLVFQFQQPPVPQTIVPVGTTTLRFDLFTSNPANDDNLFLTATFGYNDTIVIRDVIPQVRFAVVTFFNRDGLPLGTQSGPVEVIVGEDNDVTDKLGPVVPVPFESITVNPDPVNLVVDPFDETSDEQQLNLSGSFGGDFFFLPINADAVSFNAANSTVANISSTGLVSTRFAPPGVTPATNTTVTATYNFNGVTQVETFVINSFLFGVVPVEEPEIVRGSTYSEGYGSTFFGADGVQVPVSDQLSFSLQSLVEGVTVNPTTGVITTTSATPLGDFVVVVTWVDQRAGGTGLTFTDTITFTVVNTQTM